MSLPPEAVVALVQLLNALVSTDNEARSAAERSLNEEWIARRPDLLLIGLAEQMNSAQEIALRSFAAVLLRRIAPKDAPMLKEDTAESVWDRSGLATQSQVKALALNALGSEQEVSVRHKISDLVSEIDNLIEEWPEARQVLMHCTQSPNGTFRESAFRVFGTNPEILGTTYSEPLRTLFSRGLEDADKGVRTAAVQAFCLYMITTVDDTRKQLEIVVPTLMNVLPPLLQEGDSESLTFALNSIVELVESYPKIFKDMFADMVKFCIAVIHNKGLDNSARQASLEVLTNFGEVAPGMCRKNPDFISQTIVECLALMTDLGDEDDTKEWLETDDLDLDESDANHVAAEQALDRLARKLGGKSILPSAFQWLPKLIASDNWRERHASLMAISAIAEGCDKIMKIELEKVLSMVLPSVSDVHPRVRWAGCNAIGQMCTDFAGEVQNKYTAQVLNALTPALEAPEARVCTHAAAAFVNFCELADQESLEPYLDPVLQRLLGLLQRPQKYVQEQAVTTIATVADAAEAKFSKYYSSIMPLLLNVLRDAGSEEYKLLRGKAMECATLIALAVGKDTFSADASELINLMATIQTSLHTSDDPQAAYLIAAWGRICKILGSDFYPYLGGVMPPLLKSAKLKPDFTILQDEEEKEAFDEEGWEFFPMKGQQVGIKTSILEEKSAAVEMLVLYAHELKEQFQPYVNEVMKEIALPGLVFYYQDTVRSASARLLPELLNCIKLSSSGNLQLIGQMWTPVLKKLLDLMQSEPSIEILGEIYQSFYECLEVIGPAAVQAPDLDTFITSTESQLGDYGRRVEARLADHKAGDVDLEQDDDVLYEIELDEGLLSEISKTLHVLFKQHRVGFIPYWKRLLPHFQKFSNSADDNCRQWSICVYDDLIEFCGPDAWSLKEVFIRPLATGLSDASPEVRQAAAYGIGCAAQHGGEVFADLVNQSLPSLFSLIEQTDSRSEENIYATENACCAIAKICRFNSSKVSNLEEVVAAWVKTLPVTHDEQDAPYAYKFLTELISAKHSAVVSQLPAVVNAVAASVESDIVKGETSKGLLQATRVLLAALPAGQADNLVQGIPSDSRRHIFASQFFEQQ